MPETKTHIDHYQYEFRSAGTENVAILYLFNDENTLLAIAAFVDGDEPLPGPKESTSGTVTLTWRRSDLPAVIDMLRNEAPVYFTWSSEAQVARITTEEEPVGEEEYKSFWQLLFG